MDNKPMQKYRKIKDIYSLWKMETIIGVGKEAETVKKEIFVYEQYSLRIYFCCEESLSAFPQLDRESKPFINLTKLSVF